MNALISFLDKFCKDHLLDEKIFIVPSYQIGYQIGESLTLKGHSWVNLHFATLPSLAQEIASPELSKNGIKQISRAASMFIVNKIFRELKDEGKLAYFNELDANSGVIRAIHRSLSALRMAGIRSKDLYSKNFIKEDKGQEVILFLKKYEQILEEKRLIDLPGLYSFAVERAEEYFRDAHKFFLCPQNASLDSIEKEFLNRIARKNLVIVPQDPVFGIQRPRLFLPAAEDHKPSPFSDLERTPWLFSPQDAPPPFQDKSLELFKAIGPTNECREILRRIISESVPLDEVEIIHPPGTTYPSIFYVLSAKAGLNVTFSEGIPLCFAAPGKVFNGLIDWMEEDFLASHLCRMIEGGDLKLAQEKEEDLPSPLRISRYIKSAMIGWGRDRYLSRLNSLLKNIESSAELAQEEGEKEKQRSCESKIEEVKWLILAVKRLLSLIPQWDEERKLDLGELCQGVSRFLKKFSRIKNDLDREAISLISARLEEAASIGKISLSKDEVFEWLRSIGDEIRVGSSGPMPGHVHLSSFRSGRNSGRNRTFIVGLDQGTFPGIGLQDPILLDEEREKISQSLAITSDMLRENLFSLAGLISSLRGQAVLSYSSYDLIENRQSFPSSLLLQAHRLLEGDARLDYSNLLSSFTEPCSFIPGSLDKAFDEIEWWLTRLSPQTRLIDGLYAVSENFPQLGQGILAKKIRLSSSVTNFEGKVDSQPAEFHPILNKNIVMSSSRIELLARCPFGYFLRYILDISKPEELEYDPSQWLNPLKRGSLLHEIFFKFMSEIRKRKEPVDISKHTELLQKIAEETISRYKEEIPPPSEGIFEREKKDVFEALKVFLSVETDRKEKLEPLLFEAFFGLEQDEGEGIKEPAVIEVDPDRNFFLRGKIDRIDRLGKNQYRVIDYKTGRYSQFEDLECFGGGKILQHVLYALAAEQIIKKVGLDSSPQVIKSGYYFPTQRGEGNEILVGRFSRERLGELLKEILNILSTSHFVVNPDAECVYCDFVPICGVNPPDLAKAKRDFNPEMFEIFRKLKGYD